VAMASITRGDLVKKCKAHFHANTQFRSGSLKLEAVTDDLKYLLNMVNISHPCPIDVIFCCFIICVYLLTLFDSLILHYLLYSGMFSRFVSLSLTIVQNSTLKS
jgi:hypothetical protein